MPRIPRFEIDIHIGRRIRQRREDWGVTQQQLADAVGAYFQQIQRYEEGEDQITASWLYEIAYQLQVPPQWFFQASA